MKTKKTTKVEKTKKKTEKNIELWKFAKLKPYPRQAEFFHDLSDPELQALADDIQKRGLQEKIEILPDGTIISGHQRLRALKLLDHTGYEVIVRYDLVGATQYEVDGAFLGANLRRNLDRLGQAKLALGIYESERERPVHTHSWRECNDARTYIGKMIDMSGRNLDRYWNVLLTPTEVQNAFRAGKLTLVMAARVASLDSDAKKKITERIREGEKPKDVVESLLPNKGKPKKKLFNAYRAFTKALAIGLEDLSDGANKIRGGKVAEDIPLLQKVRSLLDQIIQQAESSVKHSEPQEKKRQETTAKIRKLVSGA